jgi:hypothetical protein
LENRGILILESSDAPPADYFLCMRRHRISLAIAILRYLPDYRARLPQIEHCSTAEQKGGKLSSR